MLSQFLCSTHFGFYVFEKIRREHPYHSSRLGTTGMCALSFFKKASIGRTTIAADERGRDSCMHTAGPSKDRRSQKRAHERRNLHSIFTDGSPWSVPVPARRHRTRPSWNGDMVPTASIPRSALSSRMSSKNTTVGSGAGGMEDLAGLSALTESTCTL